MRNIRKNQGAMMPECETFSKIKGPEPKDNRGTRRKQSWDKAKTIVGTRIFWISKELFSRARVLLRRIIFIRERLQHAYDTRSADCHEADNFESKENSFSLCKCCGSILRRGPGWPAQEIAWMVRKVVLERPNAGCGNRCRCVTRWSDSCARVAAGLIGPIAR